MCRLSTLIKRVLLNTEDVLESVGVSVWFYNKIEIISITVLYQNKSHESIQCSSVCVYTVSTFCGNIKHNLALCSFM